MGREWFCAWQLVTYRLLARAGGKVITVVRPQQADGREVCVAQIHKAMKDALVNLLVGHGGVVGMHALDQGQGRDCPLRLAILLSIRQCQRRLSSDRLHHA